MEPKLCMNIKMGSPSFSFVHLFLILKNSHGHGPSSFDNQAYGNLPHASLNGQLLKSRDTLLSVIKYLDRFLEFQKFGPNNTVQFKTQLMLEQTFRLKFCDQGCISLKFQWQQFLAKNPRLNYKQQVSPGIESKLCYMFVFVFSVLFLNEKG